MDEEKYIFHRYLWHSGIFRVDRIHFVFENEIEMMSTVAEIVVIFINLCLICVTQISAAKFRKFQFFKFTKA